MNRQEWLNNNPIQKFMRAEKIGFVTLFEKTKSKITPSRLQKLALGFEVPQPKEYTILADTMDMQTAMVLMAWELWLEKTPENVYERIE